MSHNEVQYFVMTFLVISGAIVFVGFRIMWGCEAIAEAMIEAARIQRAKERWQRNEGSPSANTTDTNKNTEG